MKIESMLADAKGKPLASELDEESPSEGAGASKSEICKECGLKILGAIKAGDAEALATAIWDLMDHYEQSEDESGDSY